MIEQKDKTPEQVSDEDYKLAPTHADEERLNKQDSSTADKKEQQTIAKGREIHTETNVKEELGEGVE